MVLTTVRIRVGLSHRDLGCAGYPFTVRWHSELSNAVEGFWNPVSIESVAPEAIEMFGLVWTGRRDEFCIERMSFWRAVPELCCCLSLLLSITAVVFVAAVAVAFAPGVRSRS